MERVVYAYVVADLIHTGHINALENAKALGDKLIVGVLTDSATMEKKPEPIVPFNERMAIVKALKVVDCVVAQETYSPLDNLKVIKPDVLVENSSHEDVENSPQVRYMLSQGKKVVIFPYYSRQSSTLTKEKVKDHWRGPLQHSMIKERETEEKSWEVGN